MIISLRQTFLGGLFLVAITVVGIILARVIQLTRVGPVSVSTNQQVSTGASLPLSPKDSQCLVSTAEFGNPLEVNTQVIVYSTICTITDSDYAYGGEYVTRVYIRGAGNEFNKLLLETREKSTYTSVGSIILVSTSDSYGNNEKKYYFDKYGQVIDPLPDQGVSKNFGNVSPDGQFVATLESPGKDDYRSPAIVNIIQQNNGKVKKYDFRKQVNELNGIYIDSWSADGQYVYVAGGIYEFEAPAKLWRIDTKTGKIKKYNLTGLQFPIKIYANQGIAFVTKGGCIDGGGRMVASGKISELAEESKALCPSSLYIVDLETGGLKLLATEQSRSSFGGMFLWRDKIFHNSSYGFKAIDDDSYRNDSVIRQIDIVSGQSTTYSEDESYIEWFVPEKETAVMQLKDGVYLVSLAANTKKLLGKSTIWSQGANKLGEELIIEIEGVIQ